MQWDREHAGKHQNSKQSKQVDHKFALETDFGLFCEAYSTKRRVHRAMLRAKE
ncbi:MAG: hypothetical protein FalmKO_36110 [Falsiruegeria mediterranea]